MATDPKHGKIVLTTDGVGRGMRRLLPIAALTLPFGVAFGVAASEAGLTSLQSIAMSVLTFSGAAQFAALDFWQSPLAFGSLALVALALNARHLIMGAALSPWINQLPRGRRVLTLACLSDPNFADSQRSFHDGEKDAGVLMGGGLILWASWVSGTAIGALGGGMVGAPATFGIDVVMPCFFAAVVVGQMKTVRTFAPVISASVTSVALLNLLPIGWNVVVAALVGGMTGVLLRAR
jgi:4-azaleucine resistance transporter AzlC